MAFLSNFASQPPSGSLFISQTAHTGEDVSGNCYPNKNSYSSGILNCSGVPGYSDNRFGTVDGSPSDPVDNHVYENKPFSIYGDPTHETASAINKNFYTIDAINREYISIASPRMIVKKLDREKTIVDDLLGESSGNEYFKKGIVVKGLMELNPIVQELARFGISEDEDIILKFNFTHMITRLGRPIMPGDLVCVYLTTNRIDQAQVDADIYGKGYYVRQMKKVYKINTAVPKDMFLFNWLTMECNATKINYDTERVDDWTDVYELDEVPDDIDGEIPEQLPKNI